MEQRLFIPGVKSVRESSLCVKESSLESHCPQSPVYSLYFLKK